MPFILCGALENALKEEKSASTVNLSKFDEWYILDLLTYLLVLGDESEFNG
jgi:hypothetical protein